MFPRKYEPILFGLLLSGVMSLLVSGISAVNGVALNGEFLHHWISSWLTAWLIAFPIVLFAAPMVRGVVRRLVREDDA